MTLPTRPEQSMAAIQTVNDLSTVYEVTRQDGTVLWIPKNPDNSDCLQIEAWAQDSNLPT